MYRCTTGELRCRVKLQRPNRTTADDGDIVEGWETVSKATPARKRTLGGSEPQRDATTEGQTVVEWVIRWRNDVDSTWRVVDGSRNYEIESAEDPDGFRAWIVIRSVETRAG